MENPMHRILWAALALALTTSAALAEDDVVGTWRGGPMTLSVAADGHFDWAVGPEVTDGRWKADRDLVSMQTERAIVTYAYRIEGDTLTLFDPAGSELVMERQRRRVRKPKKHR